MFWHPLFLAIISADLTALFLLLATGITFLQTALHWQPFSADRRQLSLEARVETASIQGRVAFRLFLFSAFLLVFGIANLFHEDIPGAMCGTGVCQAMAAGSTKLLIYTGLLLLTMQLWYELDRLNTARVEMPLTAPNARFFLVIPPVALLTVKQTVDTFAGIDPYQPVDCCAVVYDQFTSLTQAGTTIGLPDSLWIGGFIVLSLTMLGLSIAAGRPAADSGKLHTALAGISLLWLLVAMPTLVNILSAYHYGVLHHHCPWCLFLPEHAMVGYPLYGAVCVIAMEGFTMGCLPLITPKNPSVHRQVQDRCRRAARRIAAAEILFLIVALVPPILWRLRYGVWMTG